MKRLLSLSLSLALVFTLAACTISDGEQTAAPDGSGGSAPSSDAQAPAPSSEPESIAFDQEFSSGNYTAGVDFPAGRLPEEKIRAVGEGLDLPEGVPLLLSRELPAIVLADETGTTHLARPHTRTDPLNTPAVVP